MTPRFPIIFFGTSEFAQRILQDLYEAGLDVVAVVTRADKAAGRNLKLTPSPVKRYSLAHSPHIPVYTPDKASSSSFAEILRSHQPSLFVVAAFGEIIKPYILEIPALGSVNVHPSLLPHYRGPSPLQTALLNGDTQTGVCIIDVAEKMDAGVIFAQKSFPIEPNENFTSLQEKALFYAKDLLLGVIEAKRCGMAQGHVQDESKVTFCHKITQEKEKIDWEQPLESIHNQIRALSDKPGAWSYLQLGEELKRVKIYASELCYEIPNPKKALFIQKNNLILKVTSLQVEGKKRLTAPEFLSGLKTYYKFI